MSNIWFFCPAHRPSKTFFEIGSTFYSIKTLIKSLGGTKILSFNKVLNSLSLCFVYSVGKPCTDSVPPTTQSQIPKSRDVILFF
jgi:hypothetical protein